MDDDFLSRARDTAERIATERGEKAFNLAGFRIAHRERGIVDGFLTAVSRLPSEKEIARTIAGELVEGDPRSAAEAVRELIEKKMTGEPHISTA